MVAVVEKACSEAACLAKVDGCKGQWLEQDLVVDCLEVTPIEAPLADAVVLVVDRRASSAWLVTHDAVWVEATTSTVVRPLARFRTRLKPQWDLVQYHSTFTRTTQLEVHATS